MPGRRKDNAVDWELGAIQPENEQVKTPEHRCSITVSDQRDGFTTPQHEYHTKINPAQSSLTIREDNSPTLNNLTIEYIGTVADATLDGTATGLANGAAWAGAATVTTVYSGTESTGPNKSYNANAIASDSFTNQYAVFRFTKSKQANQWDIPDGTATLTVTAVPEPATTALLGLGGLALVLRRRR